MSPEYIYYVAMLFIVLPSMAINRLAIVVAACWIPGALALRLGVPAAPVDMAVDIVAVGIGAALARQNIANVSRGAYSVCAVADCIVVAAFVGTAGIGFAEGVESLHPYYAWWALFWVSLIQVVAIPFGNDWGRMMSGLRQFDEWLLNRLAKHFGEGL